MIFPVRPPFIAFIGDFYLPWLPEGFQFLDVGFPWFSPIAALFWGAHSVPQVGLATCVCFAASRWKKRWTSLQPMEAGDGGRAPTCLKHIVHTLLKNYVCMCVYILHFRPLGSSMKRLHLHILTCILNLKRAHALALLWPCKDMLDLVGFCS